MNQLQVVATIAERDVLRYTPAGVPVVSAILMHNSQQVEAGVERQVQFEIAAFAAGEISGRFAAAELGAAHQFTGFLARKNRNSKALVFHIIDFSAAA
ncbi:primosomal replication protein N [Massilia suwonensis]|uniref:Replication restart protein PriB n=1 Tax=Massilia suwonensis TaxID=648895 RepID=A0ABW0MNQ9_9BURK